MAIIATLIIVVTGIMLWLTLFSGDESTQQWREFSSATADVVIILTVLPMLLIVALLPVLAAGWFWYTWGSPRPVENWLQKWLWKTDSFVESSAEKVESAGTKAADYSIKYRAFASKIGRTVKKSTQSIFPMSDES